MSSFLKTGNELANEDGGWEKRDVERMKEVWEEEEKEKGEKKKKRG